METINATTKRGTAFINAYNRSDRGSLRECYSNYSSAKARAERDCIEKMHRENGVGFKILGFNSSFFTCGWMTDEGLRIETACGSYLVK